MNDTHASASGGPRGLHEHHANLRCDLWQAPGFLGMLVSVYM